MAAQGIYAGFFHKLKRRLPAVNSGKVGGTRFKSVRQILRQKFTVGSTSGAACHDRIQRFGKDICHQQRANSGGTQQSLMSRHAQRRQPEIFKINRIMSRRLGGIQHEGNTMPSADFTHSFGILDAAADVGTMSHHQQLCVGTDQQFNIRRIQ